MSDIVFVISAYISRNSHYSVTIDEKPTHGRPRLIEKPINTLRPYLGLEMDYDSETFESLRITDNDVEDCEFYSCIFKNCSFEGCSLSGCRFRECSFTDCRIVSCRARLCTAVDCRFRDCAVIGMDFSAFIQSGFGSPFDTMTECVMKYCIFEGVPLKRAVFHGTSMTECSFSGCDLSDADISECRMESTVFRGCDLSRSDFRESSGYSVDLKTCKAKGARFSYPEALCLLDGFGIVIG